jgi:hypothetical protein
MISQPRSIAHSSMLASECSIAMRDLSVPHFPRFASCPGRTVVMWASRGGV